MLLFPDAADPLGALRWNLSELRRTLDGVSITGDPLRLTLLPPWHCDALELVGSANGHGLDPRTVRRPAAGGALLRGQRRSLTPGWRTSGTGSRTASSRCCTKRRWPPSPRALPPTPSSSPRWHCAGIAFHADCTAVLVKALVALGEHRRARDEVTKCADLYHRELGLPLPAEVRRALSDSAPVADPELHANVATVRSYLDAGSASLSAGAVDRGLDQLRLAVVLAQRAGLPNPDRHLVAESLVTLAGALIHQAGGRGAEVADFLHRALSAEAPDGVSRTAAAAFRELGYLSVQRGVPDRAAGWLDRAMQAAQGIPDEQARILAIQGMLASDTAHYGDAVAAFAESRQAGPDGPEPPAAGVQRGAAGARASAPRGPGAGGRRPGPGAGRGGGGTLDGVRTVCRRGPRRNVPGRRAAGGGRGPDRPVLGDGRARRRPLLHGPGGRGRGPAVPGARRPGRRRALDRPGPGTQAVVPLVHGPAAGHRGGSHHRHGLPAGRRSSWTGWPRWPAGAACGSSWSGRSRTGRRSATRPPPSPCPGSRRRSTTRR